MSFCTSGRGRSASAVCLDRLQLQISGSGADVAALLSRAAGQGIRLKRIVPGTDGCTLYLWGRDLAAFSALAAPCTVQIVRRTGGGLLLARLLRRPGILCGFVLFLALLRVFSGYLWCIDFGTLSPASAAALRAVLAEQQITEGCRLSKPRLQAAQDAVLQQSDIFGWVSLNFVNGCLFAEATPTQTQTVQPAPSARVLCAKSAGEVLAVQLQSGFAEVKPGQFVAENQRLATCTRTDRNGRAVYQPVSGQVMARLQKRYTAQCPLQRQSARLTGRQAQRLTLHLLGHRFLLQNDTPLAGDTDTAWLPLRWGRICLPGCLQRETFWQRQTLTQTLPEAAARAVALRDCRRALLADFPDAEILQEQRTVTVQNGTAHAEVRYLFTADIAQAAQD